jgi:hypothetical protein
MQLIIRSDCPKLLTENKVQWTAPWVAHYRWKKGISPEIVQLKKPSDGYWRDDKIRLLLIKDFHNNCGYCGESLPTPQGMAEQKTERASKGDVDHLLPKAFYPELVYEWTNYIWSCKPCNQLKNNFYSINHPLLNPCCEEDCSKIVFIEDTEQYALQNTVANNDIWRERLKNSEQKTMLNADEICKKRRFKISMLCQRFTSIADYIDMIHKSPDTANLLQPIVNNDVIEISEIMGVPDFYYLLQEQYQLLLQKHPQVAALLA